MALHHHHPWRAITHTMSARSHRPRTWLGAVGALVLLTTAGLTGCSQSAGSTTSVLSIAPGPGASGPFSRDFNPLIPTVGEDGSSFFAIYEPLVMRDALTGKSQPWLATSYQWGSQGRSITIQLRPGVKWSDGQPFTAADVAFTFNLEKKFPALNSAALPITSATEVNPTTATIDFSQPEYTDVNEILGTEPVPEHVFSKVSDPATFENPDPVGTGPYVLSSFTPQVITLTKNPHYWQPGKPAIQEIRYIAYDSVGSMLAALESGQVQWASQEFYGGVNSFISRDPAHNEQISFNLGLYAMQFNSTIYPLNQAVVRKAISMTIDRQEVAELAFPNLKQPPLSPTGLDLSTQTNVIASQYQSLSYSPDPTAAGQLLQAAGYKMGPGGVRVSPRGTPLRFTILLGTGGPEQVSGAQVMAQELKPVGIDLNIQTVAPPILSADVDQGNFQITSGGAIVGTGSDPYELYNNYLDYSDSRPIGSPATIDVGRFDDPQATATLNAYADAPPGSAAQTADLQTLQQIMVNQVPVMPMFFNAGRSAYTDAQFVGWPSASDPYLQAPISWLNTAELVLLNLKPR
jgi:peptide/nickel transport system substrate-binding protein